MERQLKKISVSGIPRAITRAEDYRYLNQAEEAESICRDILAIDEENQDALRLLGLAITDQFCGGPSDRLGEAVTCFERLESPYESTYFLGIAYERRAKAQLHAGQLPYTLIANFEKAMDHFEAAEKIRPENNDESVLRWNRCVRLLQNIALHEKEHPVIEVGDMPPR
jgi:tetratricopeptide (TPR) repeat protein